MTRTQKDVIDDIEYQLDEKNYVHKLEKIGYDVYLEPNTDSYSVEVALLKNARFSKNSNFVFDKIVKIGKFVVDAGYKYKKIQDACSVERLESVLYNFFKNESRGKYKRFVNYL